MLLSWHLVAVLLGIPAAALAQSPPVLEVAPLQLTFSGDDRAERLPAQRVDIRNAGGGELVWEARAEAPWVTLAPARGLAPSALQVGIDARSMRPGNYEGRVLVAASKADRSPQTIVVRVTIASTQPVGPPGLQATPSRVTLAATPGQAQAVSSSLQLTAEGDTAVQWTARSDVEWLAVAPGRGTTPASVTVTATPASLSIGDHTGNILLSPAGRGAIVRVPVQITIRVPNGPLALATTSLPAATVNDPYSYALPIRGGQPPYTFQLAGSLPPGLSLASGVITGVPKTPGTFEFSVVAADSGDPPATLTQALTLRVATPEPAGSLLVSPDRVALAAPVGGASNSVVIQVSSSGKTPPWRVSAGAAWIRVQPDGGSGVGTITVRADATAMKSGIYQSWITVTMAGAENSPAHIPVELIVKD